MCVCGRVCATCTEISNTSRSECPEFEGSSRRTKITGKYFVAVFTVLIEHLITSNISPLTFRVFLFIPPTLVRVITLTNYRRDIGKGLVETTYVRTGHDEWWSCSRKLVIRVGGGASFFFDRPKTKLLYCRRIVRIVI